MKKISMGLMAIAGIIGIGGAFAFKPAKQVGTTYYGYMDSSGNGKWSLSRPSGASCQSGLSIACTITSTTPQATVLGLTNAFPAQNTIVNGSGSVYQPN
ncbi:hypothetical protein BDD43_0680 [Mucilaginibacter gracilis]|uniref:Uncharacterized protein n=1 Tax=Mucilaginibacter gracilis TaxID=423350 RepID=A0A495IXE9_9SPHI|nr:hypothetical protein [Mucilaginibacter gracilis]RKR80559.1 hypothetical protein BDD43_0680 [Mucilaginibacter gracilis]